MLSIIKLKDIATLIGSACGFFAIILTISSYHAYRLALAMIFIATISDTLDGYIARKLNQANEFGKELDSLSDFLLSVLHQQSFLLVFIPKHPLLQRE